jgi:hypothetical protein
VLNAQTGRVELRVHLAAGVSAVMMVDGVHRSEQPLVHGHQQTDAAVRGECSSHIAQRVNIVVDVLKHIQADGGVQVAVAELEKRRGTDVHRMGFEALVRKAEPRHVELLRDHVDADHEFTVRVKLRDIADRAAHVEDAIADVGSDLLIDPSVVIRGARETLLDLQLDRSRKRQTGLCQNLRSAPTGCREQEHRQSYC